MKRALVVLFILSSWLGPVYGDSWVQPFERDFFSESKRFVAHVTPVTKIGAAQLKLYLIEHAERKLLWKCELGNKNAPVEVYVSNDGKSVVTNNEWGQSGYGDFVVAFYGEKGMIKNYSMEEILHLPADIEQAQLRKLIRKLMPHSVSSRRWDLKSIKFFADYDGRTYFCIWLGLFGRWVAWDTSNGKEAQISSVMLETLNEKGRLWSLKELTKRVYDDTPYEFLGQLKCAEDKHIIKGLLSHEQSFRTRISSRFKKKVHVGTTKEYSVHELLCYTAFSPKRALGERILAEWNGRTESKSGSSEQQYYYLGKVKGTVKLPRPPKSGKPEIYHEKDGVLCVYLVPNTIPKSKWNQGRIVHRLAASFDRYSFDHCELTENFPFCFEGVTPGKYWVKAVWGRAKSFGFYAGTSTTTGAPQKGDYQSLNLPLVTVKAGETTEGVVVNCTHAVTEDTGLSNGVVR